MPGGMIPGDTALVLDRLQLVPLDRRRIGDFERLLGGKEFGGCYCAVWYAYGADWEERCRARSSDNLELTARRVRSGEHAGFLLVREVDGAVVGWTGSGPKPAYPLLKERPGSRLGPWSETVWAVGCLAVSFPYRGLGYARQAVRLLIEEARAAGAEAVEAYPVDPAFEGAAYRGSRRLYEALGFVPVGVEPSGERQVLRMELRLVGEPSESVEVPVLKVAAELGAPPPEAPGLEPQPVLKPKAKRAPRAKSPKPEPRTEPKPEPQPEPAPAARPEPEPASKPEAEPAPEAPPAPEAQAGTAAPAQAPAQRPEPAPGPSPEPAAPAAEPPGSPERPEGGPAA